MSRRRAAQLILQNAPVPTRAIVPDWLPDWSGQTCVIVASGPSASKVDLTPLKGKAKFIAINESWRLAPWADILYGCDDAYWHSKKGVKEFVGLKMTQDRRAVMRYRDIKFVLCDRKCEELILNRFAIGWGGNSGFHCINLAVHLKVSRIILVGYDMNLDRGIHWHGPHPFHMNNPTRKNVDRWRRVVDNAYFTLEDLGIKAVNASPDSALVNYPKIQIGPSTGEEMRILMIGPELKDVSEVKNFSGVYSYYIRKELAKRDVRLTFMNRPSKETALDFYKSIDLRNIDHVVALGSRHFERMPLECARYLVKKVKGVVAQFNDQNLWRAVVPLTFIVKGTNTKENCVIGWGADPALCRPMQARKVLRVLIDHPDYVWDRGDITPKVVADAQAFASSNLWKGLWDSVEVVRWADGAIVDTTQEVNEFHRNHIPFDKACLEYSQAHLFLLTHPESIGLSTLESSMAGALPLVPEGFMAKELLKTIRHIEYKDHIPWPLVLKEISINASRTKALGNSWGKVVDRMVKGLVEFKS